MRYDGFMVIKIPILVFWFMIRIVLRGYCHPRSSSNIVQNSDNNYETAPCYNSEEIYIPDMPIHMSA
jgi:hypothetical protein